MLGRLWLLTFNSYCHTTGHPAALEHAAPTWSIDVRVFFRQIETFGVAQLLSKPTFVIICTVVHAPVACHYAPYRK